MTAGGRPLSEQLAGYRLGEAGERREEQGVPDAPDRIPADVPEGGGAAAPLSAEDDDETLENLLAHIPGDLSAEIERDHARHQAVHLLEMQEYRGRRGPPATVEIAVMPGQVELRAFGTGGLCTRCVVADTGWSACCHYPLSARSGIVYLTRTEEVQQAMEGTMVIHGDVVDTEEIVTFLGRHLRMVIGRLMDDSVGSALTYRQVNVRAPQFLLPPLRAIRTIAPHIRLETA